MALPTQARINQLLDAFIVASEGRKLDYPSGYFAGECLSLVKRWVDKVAAKTVAPASGTGWGDGYYSIFPAPLSDYFTREKFNPYKAYPRGSLIVYSKTHHIAIVNKSVAGSPTTNVFQQNANPDGSPARTYDRPNGGASPATGVLVIKVAAPPAPAPKMPPVGSFIQLIPVGTRTTFRAGTTTQAGTIRVRDNTYLYQVRGYDRRFPGRILINSESAGGNGVALALYYTNGSRINGWKQVN